MLVRGCICSPDAETGHEEGAEEGGTLEEPAGSNCEVRARVLPSTNRHGSHRCSCGQDSTKAHACQQVMLFTLLSCCIRAARWGRIVHWNWTHPCQKSQCEALCASLLRSRVSWPVQLFRRGAP